MANNSGEDLILIFVKMSTLHLVVLDKYHHSPKDDYVIGTEAVAIDGRLSGLNRLQIGGIRFVRQSSWLCYGRPGDTWILVAFIRGSVEWSNQFYDTKRHLSPFWCHKLSVWSWYCQKKNEWLVLFPHIFKVVLSVGSAIGQMKVGEKYRTSRRKYVHFALLCSKLFSITIWIES